MYSSGYSVVEGQPSIDEYRDIRATCGLSPRSAEAARMGLNGTWFGLVAKYDGAIIGMGRIVGDGGSFFQIVDIAVLPEHQGHGVGEELFAALLTAIRAKAPSSAYVSLLADGDAKKLYARHGFVDTAPESVGMYLVI